MGFTCSFPCSHKPTFRTFLEPLTSHASLPLNFWTYIPVFIFPSVRATCSAGRITIDHLNNTGYTAHTAAVLAVQLDCCALLCLGVQCSVPGSFPVPSTCEVLTAVLPRGDASSHRRDEGSQYLVWACSFVFLR
jgi:hypothetical protein